MSIVKGLMMWYELSGVQTLGCVNLLTANDHYVYNLIERLTFFEAMIMCCNGDEKEAPLWL